MTDPTPETTALTQAGDLAGGKSGDRPMHTAGPWVVEAGKGQYANEIVHYGSRSRRIVVARVGGGPAARDGNAHLLSAALDLREALEACLKDLTGVPFGSERQSRAALLKASGNFPDVSPPK